MDSQEAIRDFPENFASLGLGEDFESHEEPSSAEDKFFDCVVGHIEDVLMEDGFQKLQKSFLEKYWQEFESGEENKLCYMEIFNEYIQVIEKYIENHLANKIPNFSMQDFIYLLQQRKNELNGEVFEVLDTFSDFLAFKEMFLDYRAIKEGTVDDLSQDINVYSRSKR